MNITTRRQLTSLQRTAYGRSTTDSFEANANRRRGWIDRNQRRRHCPATTSRGVGLANTSPGSTNEGPAGSPVQWDLPNN
jgi:hypothetical protein